MPKFYEIFSKLKVPPLDTRSETQSNFSLSQAVCALVTHPVHQSCQKPRVNHHSLEGASAGLNPHDKSLTYCCRRLSPIVNQVREVNFIMLLAYGPISSSPRSPCRRRFTGAEIECCVCCDSIWG